MPDEQKPKPNRARTRAIRERMAQTGEPYTVAARAHDAERAATNPPNSTGEQP